MTLTSDLVFKNYCVQSISAILFDVGIPNLGWWFLLGWRSGAYHFESLWLCHWLLASFLGFSCYITAIFPQICLMLDQFLWGHSSRVCDISCCSLSYPAKKCCRLLYICCIYSNALQTTLYHGIKHNFAPEKNHRLGKKKHGNVIYLIKTGSEVIKLFHAQLHWAWNLFSSLMLKCQHLLEF